MLEARPGRREKPIGPNFNPATGIRWSNLNEAEGLYKALPRLDFMGTYTAEDSWFIYRARELLRVQGRLDKVGRGGDVVAYSTPDLGFVIKFPYDDATLLPTGFSYQLAFGYSLAKEYLGGIFAPCIDRYGVFTDHDGVQTGVMSLFQAKAKTVDEVISELPRAQREEKIIQIKKDFILLNERMWERGLFDSDTNWYENYGYLPDGTFVMIDAGWVMDDPNEFPLHEGMSRLYQYEADLKDYFTVENFRRHFGKNPYAAARAGNPTAYSLTLHALRQEERERLSQERAVIREERLQNVLAFRKARRDPRLLQDLAPFFGRIGYMGIRFGRKRYIMVVGPREVQTREKGTSKEPGFVFVRYFEEDNEGNLKGIGHAMQAYGTALENVTDQSVAFEDPEDTELILKHFRLHGKI